MLAEGVGLSLTNPPFKLNHVFGERTRQISQKPQNRVLYATIGVIAATWRHRDVGTSL
jgi:hypothetical protein